MAQGFDSDGFQSETLEVVLGLQGEMQAFADQIIEDKRRPAREEGSIPLEDDMLPRQGEGGKPRGSDVRYVTSTLGNTSYNMLDYDRGKRLSKNEAEQIQANLEGLKRFVRARLRGVLVDIDNDLQSLLTDSNQNKEQAAGNAWDSGSETIAQNIQDAADKVGGNPDTVIIGHTTIQKMQKSPEIVSKVGNYAPSSGSDGHVAVGAVEDYVDGLLPKADVFTPDTDSPAVYNSDESGQGSVTPAWVFDSLFWVGHRRGMIMVEQPYTQATRGSIFTKEEHKHIEWSLTRTLDLVRGIDELGCFISGT